MYSFKLSAEGTRYCAEHPEAARLAAAMAHPVTGFRVFLDYWYFRPEGGEKMLLGPSLWPAQEEFVRAVSRHKWIFFLKARKLGETTIEEAYDAWVIRFGGPNARVHILSRNDNAAMEAKARVVFGLRNLPWWLRLPEITDNAHELVLDADANGDGDRRTLKAYPTSDRTADEASCTHAHVDELAKMLHPEKVWQTTEPTIVPGGSCHIVTTGQGAGNWASDYYDKCRKGEGKHVPVFIDALQRPDRDEAWLVAQRRLLGNDAGARQEYPMTEEDALSAGVDLIFDPAEIEMMCVDYLGFMPPIKGRRYAKGVDLGQKDAFVITVIDYTDPVLDVVYQKRLVGASYPQMQQEIEYVDKIYRGPLLVENNGVGAAVIENLNITEERAKEIRFNTTEVSKLRIVSQVKLHAQNQCLKFNPDECPEMLVELKTYRLPDKEITQDTVMSLAIAVEAASRPQGGGVRAVSEVG